MLLMLGRLKCRLSPASLGLKLKRCKLLGTCQVLAELNQPGSKTVCFDIYRLPNSIWNKEELAQQWKESVIVLIYKKGDKTDCSSNYQRIITSFHLHTKWYTTVFYHRQNYWKSAVWISM
jgi:hypothetical protein